MKKYLLLMMLIAGICKAQIAGQPKTTILTSNPAGSCTNGRLAVNITAGTSWICNGGWVQLTVGAGGGTVTSVATGTGLTGGPIVATGTVSMTTAQVTRTAILNDINPAAADDGIITILNPATAVHLTRISCGVTGLTSVVVNLEKGAASLISDMTATAGDINTVVVTTWANGAGQCGGTTSCAVAAHAPVTVHIGAIVGTPTNLACAVDYTVD